MKVVVRTAGETATLEVRGALIIGTPVEGLRSGVSSLLDRGFREIVVELSRVPFADACGLGALVECRRKAQEAGATLRVTGAAGKLRELFALTELPIEARPVPRRLPGVAGLGSRLLGMNVRPPRPLKYRVA
jgi:anti-anti-sigma factor